MAAAYSSIVSLLQELELLLSSYDRFVSSARDRSRLCPFTEEEIQILLDNFRLMDSSLRDPSGDSYNREMINSFGNRIIRVARRAELYVDLQFLEGDHEPTGIRLPGSPRLKKFDDIWIRAIRNTCHPKELVEINEELCLINTELKRLNHDNGSSGASNHPEPGASTSAGESNDLAHSARMSTNTGGKLVGLETELLMMLDRLSGQPLQLKVLAISGMGGIGKTTFARRIFDDPFVVHHFYVRVWTAVAPQSQLREILLGFLSCVSNKADEMYDMSTEQLREQVYKSLKHKRYLIVMDDMWDNKVWDDLKRIFPDDRNGSRIMLTTRLTDVAVHADPDAPPHLMHCLTQDQSWELLSLKLFGNDSCPVSLVSVGKKIAHKCRGLPLAIIVVAGILSKMKFTLEIWEEVAERVSSLVMESPQDCQKILALSYDNLPDQLKSCFLYMMVFPKDYEIPAKKLIWLWISEGFIRPRKHQSLEQVGEHYLQELISRNLVLVKRKGANDQTKTCYIHDLMRELFLKESQRENSLLIINGSEQTPTTVKRDLRLLSFHYKIPEYMMRPTTFFPLTRSLFCFETLRSTDLKHCSGISLKVLRVLEVAHLHQIVIPVGLVHLRYLVLTVKDSSMITKILRKLLFLQTFTAYCQWDGLLPCNIFDMQELRHFYLKRSDQSDFSNAYEETTFSASEHWLSHTHELENIEKPQPDFKRQGLLLSVVKKPCVLQNLQSLSAIRAIECTREAFLMMPRLKKLGIHETEEDFMVRGWIKNLVYLRELEKLKYSFYNPFVSTKMKPDRLPSFYLLPPKLTSLTLSGTTFPWEDMSKLAMLPKLEVLKLRNYAFSGLEWRTKEGGFSRLKFLLIGSTNLDYGKVG